MKLTPKAQAQRLRVFSAVRAWMIRYNECPTGVAIADELDIHPVAAQKHMKALRRADGLPMPIVHGNTRSGRAAQESLSHSPVSVDRQLAQLRW